MLKGRKVGFWTLLAGSMLVSLCAFAGTPMPVSPFDIPQGAYRAEFVEDRDHISIIQFTGNYDRDLPGGEPNLAARAVVAEEFFKHHPDNVDFLVVFSAFEFDSGDAVAFVQPVQNSVQGIGVPIFSNAHRYGSENLKSVIDMAALSRYELNALNVDPENLNAGFNFALSTLAHETLHSWAAFPQIPSLQGKDGAHWSFYLNSNASVHYGHHWHDNEDGTFTSNAARLFYSPLDLYLMGMLSPDEVPDTFVIEPDTNEYLPTDLPEVGVTVSGQKSLITIDQFIAAHGPRIPAAAAAQKTFRYAFVYLTTEDTVVNPIDLAKINNVRKAYAERFPIMTGGRGVAHIYPESISPFKPGEYVTVGNDDYRTTDASVADGLNWLKSQQLSAGNWQDKAASSVRDTVIATQTLSSLDGTFDAQTADAWLADELNQSLHLNTDSKARILQRLLDAGQLQSLIDAQNSDGGWGLSGDLESSVLDTALLIDVLKHASGDAQVLARATDYLQSQQNPDGGWGVVGSAVSSVSATNAVLQALGGAGSANTQLALDWLSAQQGDDAGFGDPISTVNETAQTILTFFQYKALAAFDLNGATAFLQGRQATDGSWEGSVYKTALAMQAMQSVGLPNVTVAAIETESTTLVDGERLAFYVQIANDSSQSVAASQAQVYLGDVATGDLVADLAVPALPAFSSIRLLVFWDSLGHVGTQTLVAVADSAGVIVERSETDNQRSIEINVTPAPDGVELEVSDTDFVVSPSQPDSLPSTLAFAASVRNVGNTDANTVLAELWRGQPGSGSLVDSQLISVPARATIPVNIAYELAQSGQTEFVLLIDANAAFTEVDETNNTARVVVTTEDTVDLEVTTADIAASPEQPVLSEDVSFSVTVRNRGTALAANAQIDFAVSTNEGTQPLESVTVSLEPGEERLITRQWLADTLGSANLVVTLDPGGLLAESDETNNTAQGTVVIDSVDGANLAVNFADIEFVPETALEGGSLTLSARIYNNGTVNLPAQTVAFYDNNPLSGGALLGSVMTPPLPAGASEVVQWLWPSVDGADNRFIYVVADSDNATAELDESDNTAFKELIVQSLPDLAVDTGSITTNPGFPGVGAPVDVTVYVTNLGVQAATAVPVEIYDNRPALGGNLLHQAQITVPASGAAQTGFTHQFDTPGEHTLHVVVNGNGSVLESRVDNNQATRSFTIQNGDFYVSDRFVSPDGNGVKDSVEYVYSVDAENADAFEVVLLDSRDREVRVFESASIDNGSGSVIWAGRSAEGGLLADGNYRFAVKLADGSTIGQTLVTLDTNRSALSEALNSDFGLTNNLTCTIGENVTFHSRLRAYDSSYHFPDTPALVYGPQDQYAYFATFFEAYTNNDGQLITTDENTLYPTGLYRAATDGREVFQLMSGDELAIENLADIVVSPDGQTVMALLRDRQFVLGQPQITYEFVAIRDGGQQIDRNSIVIEQDVQLSHLQFIDNQRVMFAIDGYVESSNYPVRLFSLSINEGAIIDQLMQFDFGFGQQELTPEILTLNAQGDKALILFADRSELYRAPFSLLSGSVSQAVWVDLQTRQSLTLSDNAYSIAWSPVGDQFAVGSAEGLTLYSESGTELQSFDFSHQQNQFSDAHWALLESELGAAAQPFAGAIKGRIKNITWNPDGTEFAFIFEDYLASLRRYWLDLPFATLEQQSLLESYDNRGGIYRANLADSTTTQHALALPIRFVALGGPVGGLPETASLDKTLAEQTVQGLMQKTASQSQSIVLPTSLDRPVINLGWQTLKRRLYWLPGAREVLLSSGSDEVRSLLATPEFLKDEQDLNLTGDNPSDAPVHARSVLINFDVPQASAYVFPGENLAREFTDFISGSDRFLRLTDSARYISFYSDNAVDACSNGEALGYRQFQSLLNLTADLRVRKSSQLGGILLDGTATDKHFSHYRLEYTDVDNPDAWQLIAPASTVPVVDDRLTTWVPPTVGAFFVRLTVVDLAGNERQVIRRVTNAENPSISGVYLQPAMFSPNGDGVLDEAELHFRVLEPVNLSVSIYDSNNALLREIIESYDVIGSQQQISWDGRNESGLVAPDGQYRVVVQNYEFFITLDNTAPELADVTPNVFQPVRSNGLRCDNTAPPEACFVSRDGTFRALASDATRLESVILERTSNALDWHEVALTAFDESVQTAAPESLNDLASFDYRFVATDSAGNVTVAPVAQELKAERVHLERIFDGTGTGGDNRFGFQFHPTGNALVTQSGFADYVAEMVIENEQLLLQLAETIDTPLSSVAAEYRVAVEDGDTPNAFTTVPVTEFIDSECIDDGTNRDAECVQSLTEQSAGEVTFVSDIPQALLGLGAIELRIRLIDTANTTHYSDTVLMQVAPLSAQFFVATANDSYAPVTGLTTDLVSQRPVYLGINRPWSAIGPIEVSVASVGTLLDVRYIEPSVIETLVAGAESPVANRDTLLQVMPDLVNECGYDYELTFTGQISDGIEARAFDYRQTVRSVCTADFTVRVVPELASQCGAGPVHRATLSFTNLDPQTVTLVVGTPGLGLDELDAILFNENLPGSGFSYVLDTSALPAGDYSLRAIATNDEGDKQVQNFYVPVVHDPVDISISYPQPTERVCATQYRDTLTEFADAGDQLRFPWNGVELQGRIRAAGPMVAYDIVDADHTEPLYVPQSAIGQAYQGLFGEQWARQGFELVFGGAITETLEGITDDSPLADKRSLQSGHAVRVASPVFNPVSGSINVNGTLGIPLIDAATGDLPRRIRAVNWSGALSCAVIDVDVDWQVDGLHVALAGGALAENGNAEGGFNEGESANNENNDSLRLYAPGSGDVNDLPRLTLSVDEAVSVDMTIFSTRVENNERVDDESIRLVAQQQSLIAGSHELVWDGLDDGGQLAPDGVYYVYLAITDGCGNLTTRRFVVELDNTGPEMAIDYPLASDSLPIDALILGSALDANFASYQLIAQNSETTITLGEGTERVESDVLGEWNTYQLQGNWELVLTARDVLDNVSELTVPLVLGQRENLISSHTATDGALSPNGDGRLDTLVVRTVFQAPVVVDFEVVDSLSQDRWALQTGQSYAPGSYTVVWDGTNAAGQVVADGDYQIVVTARLAGDLSVLQTEPLTVSVDTQSPEVALDQLTGSDLALGGADVITGSISDTRLQEYVIELTSGGDITVPVVLGSGARNTAGVLAELAESFTQTDTVYQVRVLATDVAGNETRVQATLQIDTQAPVAELSEPVDRAVVNSESTVAIEGRATDAFLSRWQLDYRAVGTGDWTVIAEQVQAVDTALLANWDTTGLADGEYELRLTVIDRAGNISVDTRLLVMDNTPPVAEIDDPQDNGYVTEVSSIAGTASDAHLRDYQLSAAPGTNPADGDFQLLVTSTRSVTNGPLMVWQPLPADGAYTVKLTVTDQAGNTSVVTRAVTVDTLAPDAITLDSAVYDKDAGTVTITWQASNAADLAGYWLYRNGSRVNDTLLTSTEYADSGLPDGEYRYAVVAVDRAALASDLSNEESVLIDTTPPEVVISSPADGARVTTLVDITGTAYSETDFSVYRVLAGTDLNHLTLVKESSLPINGGELAQWNTLELVDGQSYWLRLEAEDESGNRASVDRQVVLDNTAPAAPTALTAVLQANGEDVALNWQHQAVDTDLAGFLLYRNDTLVNADGVIVGDLTPYLLDGLLYDDLAAPDGELRFVVYAVDSVGNISDPSNTATVTIERRAPVATFIEPQTGDRFERTLYLQAETVDEDIASVVFEYRPTGDTAWQTINTDTAKPFDASWDADALPDGGYELRVIATDAGGLTDPAPHVISVTKQDLTAPAVVTGLAVTVAGSTGELNWQANNEPDLAGYIVYRKCPTCADFTEVTAAPIMESIFEDTFTESGVFEYQVVAVDTIGNQSLVSETVEATYFTTLIEANSQIIYNAPATVTVGVDIPLADAAIEVITQLPDASQVAQSLPLASGTQEVQTDVPAQQTGWHSASATGALNAGSFTGRSSELRYILPASPSVPGNVSASYQSADNTVRVDWTANVAAELVAGYQIARNDALVSEFVVVDSETAVASHELGGNIAANTLPSSTYNAYWESNVEGAILTHSWSEPELVSSMELDWWQYYTKALELEVFALIEGEYIKLAHETYANDTTDKVVITLTQPVPTTSIRLQFNRWASTFWGGRLLELRVIGDSGFVSANAFADVPNDGVHTYQVRAVSAYGAISDWSDATNAVPFGDVVPPDAPLLSLNQNGQVAELNWTAPADAVNYSLLRNGESVYQGPNTDFADGPLINGNYDYRVIAIDAVGNESAQSNAQSIIIDEPLPFAPTDLQADVYADGSGVALIWQGSSSDGYRVYRSVSMTGPFTAIGESNPASFDDLDVVPDAQVFYQVVALDAVGNESDPSNIVSVVVTDLVAPLSPVIVSPTTAAEPFVSMEANVAISGFAEAGSQVFLLVDGNYTPPLVDVSSEISVTAIPDQGFGTYAASSSGDVLYSGFAAPLVWNGSDWVSLAGVTLAAGQFVSSLHWGENRVAIVRSSDGRLYYYDARTQSGGEIVLDTTGYQWITGYAYDPVTQTLIAKFNHEATEQLFTVDIATGTYQALPAADYAQVSPDGNSVLYVPAGAGSTASELRLYRVLEGSEQAITVNPVNAASLFASGNAIFAPNSQSLLLRHADGSASTVDTKTAALTMVDQGAVTGSDITWAGSRHLVWLNADNQLIVYDTATLQSDVMTMDANALGLPSVSSLAILGVTERLELLVKEQAANRYFTLALPGVFTVETVALLEGDNPITAFALDASANLSAPSDAVTIIYQPRASIDLAVSGEINPAAALVDLTATLELEIANQGEIAANGFDWQVSVISPQGVATVLRKEATSLGAQSTQTVSIPWTPEEIGDYTFVITADGDQVLDEFNRGNNTQILSVSVVATAEPELQLRLNNGPTGYAFAAGADLAGSVSVVNNGPYFTGSLRVEVMDSNDALTQTLIDQAITGLDYAASQTVDYHWNTGLVFAGNYQIRAQLLASDGSIIEEEFQAFEITAELAADLRVSTDRTRYAPGQAITVRATATNRTANQLLTNAEIELSVQDSSGQVVRGENISLPIVLANDPVTVSLPEFTLADLGSYTITAELTEGTQTLATETVPIEVTASLTGQLTVMNPLAIPGQTVSVDAQLTNNSDVDLTDMAASLQLVSAGGVLDTHSINLTLLETGQTHVFSHTFATAGLLPGDYQVTLVALPFVSGSVQAAPVVLATDGFQLTTAQTPSVSVVAPLANAIINNQQQATASITAVDAIGIESAEYDVGNGWQPATVNGSDATQYEFDISALAEGAYQLTGRATNTGGLTGLSAVIPFTIDTSAPQIGIDDVANDAFYNTDVVPLFSVSDPHLRSVMYRLNGREYTPGEAITADGEHIVSVVAADVANNRSQVVRRFTVDTTAPTIRIENVVDGGDYLGCVQPQISQFDDNPDTLTVTLNGNNIEEGFTVCDAREHTLRAVAVDLAGNQSERQITFTVSQLLAAQTALSTGSVAPGDALLCEHTITNNGDQALTAMPFRQVLRLVNTDSDSQNFALDIAAGATVTNTLAINTTALSAGNYACVLQRQVDQVWQDVSQAPFTVTDTANTAPIARDDVVATTGVASINVLANDEDVDGDALLVTIISQPVNGSLTQTGNGTVQYTPQSGFLGQDRFVYQIDDQRGGTDQATVFIEVDLDGDCSLVPDHETTWNAVRILPGWARKYPATTPPQYRIQILSVSDPSLFAPGGLPTISFPECTLRYQAVDDRRDVAEVHYRIVDAATNGQQYQSLPQTFRISIKTGLLNIGTLIPILQLLLLDDPAGPEPEPAPPVGNESNEQSGNTNTSGKRQDRETLSVHDARRERDE